MLSDLNKKQMFQYLIQLYNFFYKNMWQLKKLIYIKKLQISINLTCFLIKYQIQQQNSRNRILIKKNIL